MEQFKAIVVGTEVNYANPPIPEGYIHILGEWNKGFVIQRVSDGSEFVWVPVGYLDADGTFDGKHFSRKFGRRNYLNDNFLSLTYTGWEHFGYFEWITDEFIDQIESITKYGGYYISRYNISVSSDGKPQSVKGKIPLECDHFSAERLANTIEQNETVRSHLPFGSEYDSVLAWLIKSGAKTLNEITKDSTKWGNYGNKLAPDSKTPAKTGSNEKWCANNICDFCGNLYEWTQERYYDLTTFVFRGDGCYCGRGKGKPVSSREYSTYYLGDSDFVGFRIALCIK